MKKIILIILVVAVSSVLFITFWRRSANQAPAMSNQTDTLNVQSNSLATPPASNNMKISSYVFDNQSNIPAKYSCDNENINPPLNFSGVPSGAKSLVLIVEDPDAPNGTWTHWTLWNINPQTKEIRENSVPNGAIQGITSANTVGYGGPCPPSGTHRYFFKLFALDTKLNLASSANVSELQDAINGHIIESAELIGLYSRR